MRVLSSQNDSLQVSLGCKLYIIRSRLPLFRVWELAASFPLGCHPTMLFRIGDETQKVYDMDFVVTMLLIFFILHWDHAIPLSTPRSDTRMLNLLNNLIHKVTSYIHLIICWNVIISVFRGVTKELCTCPTFPMDSMMNRLKDFLASLAKFHKFLYQKEKWVWFYVAYSL